MPRTPSLRHARAALAGLALLLGCHTSTAIPIEFLVDGGAPPAPRPKADARAPARDAAVDVARVDAAAPPRDTAAPPRDGRADGPLGAIEACPAGTAGMRCPTEDALCQTTTDAGRVAICVCVRPRPNTDRVWTCY